MGNKIEQIIQIFKDYDIICPVPFEQVAREIDALYAQPEWGPAHGYPLPCAKCGLKDEVAYICHYCYKEFYDMEEFIEHKKKHEPKKLYPPDTAYFIKKWQLHKATKVIENGYFCPFCFDQQPYTVGGFINYHRCPNNNMVLSGYD